MNSYFVIYRKHCVTVDLFAEGRSDRLKYLCVPGKLYVICIELNEVKY